MIVKVVGMHMGKYREMTFDDVEKYVFTKESDEASDMVFEGSSAVPYSHLMLMFAKREPVSILFNTKAYVMSEITAKTIDVLGHKG